MKDIKMIYKKAFGQHFLNDEGICQDIVNLLFKDNDMTFTDEANYLLEIGPGAGAISQYIVQHPWTEYKAVEIDEHKINFLVSQNILKPEQIIASDFLKINAPFEHPFRIIGNFPYNISTQIMFKIFEWYPLVYEVVGMFQKEVALRICSSHGSKDYGILSILTQVLYNTSVEIHLPPHYFTPPPKVDSTVIRLVSNNNAFGISNFRKFTSFVKTSFAMRRKTLRNNLKGTLPAEILQDEFFNNRPEQVSIEKFVNLYKSYLKDE